jgi:hypothetical protein
VLELVTTSSSTSSSTSYGSTNQASKPYVTDPRSGPSSLQPRGCNPLNYNERSCTTWACYFIDETKDKKGGQTLASKPGRTREYSARNKQPLSWQPRSVPRGLATDTPPTVRHQGRTGTRGKHDIYPSYTKSPATISHLNNLGLKSLRIFFYINA